MIAKYAIIWLAVTLLLSWGAHGFTYYQLTSVRKELKTAVDERAVARAETRTAAGLNAEFKLKLEECVTVNHENDERRTKADQDMRVAKAELKMLRDQLSNTDMTVEKTDDECRALDARLPGEFVRQLCIDRAANCS